MGRKTVGNDLDNAWISFDNVIIPKSALLNKYADINCDGNTSEYVQKVKGLPAFHMIGSSSSSSGSSGSSSSSSGSSGSSSSSSSCCRSSSSSSISNSILISTIAIAYHEFSLLVQSNTLYILYIYYTPILNSLL
jgi:hypothetical protein